MRFEPCPCSALATLLPAVLAAGLPGQAPQNASPIYVTATMSLPPGATYGRVVAGDTNRDGRQDVLVPVPSLRMFVIGQNDGAGGLTPHTVALPPGADGPSDCSEPYEAGGDGHRDDLAVACGDSDSVALVSDCGSLSPTVTVVPLPGGLQKPVSAAATNQGDGTPTVAVACEGRVFGGGGGGAVRVGGGGSFTTLPTTRSKYTRFAFGSFTGDGNQDLAGLWSGGVDFWKCVGSGGTYSYSPAGSLSAGSGILDAFTVGDGDGDGRFDVSVVENDLFANPPACRLWYWRNTGSGSLGPSRFSSFTYPLAGRSYVRSWSWGNRCACDISGYRSFRTAFYCDAGGQSVRCTDRFEDFAFTPTGLADHEVSSAACDSVASFEFDGDNIPDVANADQATSTLEVHRSVPFPADDGYGTGCGSSTLDSEGTLDLGDTWTLRVNTDSFRPAVVLLAATPTDATISPGCSLRVGPSLMCTPVTFSDASGVARLRIDVPNQSSILAQEVYGQAAVVKPGGAHGGLLDVTEARRGKVGDCQ